MAGSFVDTMVGQTMNLDLSKTIGGNRSVSSLCTDLFLIVIRMREAENLGDPAALRKLIAYYLDLFKKNCATFAMNPEAIEDVTYALVALIDETVLSIPGECRDFWLSHPLQLDFFGHSNAGQEFFKRLEKILLESEKKKDVLVVYYLCLSLGFEGKYKIGNMQERATIIEDLGIRLKKLKVNASTTLSPHAYHAEGGKPPKGKVMLLPLWIAATVCIASLAILYGAFFLSNETAVRSIITRIQSLSQR